MSDIDESDSELIDPDIDDTEEIKVKKEKNKKLTATKLSATTNIDSEEEIDNNNDDDDDDDDDVAIINNNLDSDEDDDEEDDDDDDDEDDKNKLDNISDSQEDNNTNLISPINSDVESDDENYLQKFDPEERDEYVKRFHPECLTSNSVEIEHLTRITRDNNNNIIDNNHKTQPILSKYEKTKILGQRAKQINMGSKPYIDVKSNIIDGYLIAQLELKEKKIPVIIYRPLPGGKSEYWKLSDLEQL
jgi:DNA-directed RNA polymerase subunit K/omega